MQGVVRRRYRAYWQGLHNSRGAHCEVPEGASFASDASLRPLARVGPTPMGRALPQTPYDVLKA